MYIIPEAVFLAAFNFSLGEPSHMRLCVCVWGERWVTLLNWAFLLPEAIWGPSYGPSREPDAINEKKKTKKIFKCKISDDD